MRAFSYSLVVESAVSLPAETFAPGETRCELPGPAGRLEAVLMRPERSEERPALVVCCHPHPQHGGTMTNKVIHSVAKAFTGLGLPSLRFNFRGTGLSEGAWDEGRGETEDILAALAWAEAQFPGYEQWLAGFSFGAYTSLLAAARRPVRQILSVAPPVHRFDFSDFQRPACPWLVIMPEADEVVSPAAVFAWLDDMTPPAKLVRYPDTGHFFHGKLIALRETIASHYAAAVPARVGR
ncbi:MAG: alpha/beta hydrolase [Gammaproteobacteria bacterium]|nr:alpha/beta hydrolase [Gammaproteobacteria bacterium]